MLLVLCLAALPAPAAPPAPEENPAVPVLLDRAESFFLALKARKYAEVFADLTAKSQKTIVSETLAALSAAERAAPTREAVRRDFENGGPLAAGYWDGFLRRFDPDIALEHSRWRMGAVEKDRAEILLTYEGSQRPAVLRMYREGGKWRVGLVETFWAR